MKVIEALNVDKTDGDIGVEIEVEGEDLLPIENAFWRCEDDGSLRGRFPDQRCEYIFKKPMVIGKVEAAIKHLAVFLKDSKLKFSHRCSVHVHLNVQQMEFQQLLTMMYTYYLIEEPFMTYCGKARKGNNFCLRLEDAEGILEDVGSLFINGADGVHGIQRDRSRYAAMNFEALLKYGSVEFRGMEGNLDVGRITTWAKALVALRTYATKLDTPKAVYDRFNELGPRDFLKDVLGDLYEVFTYPRLDRDMMKSFSISIDLPFKFIRGAEKVKDPEDWQIGDIVDYEQAVDLIARGGNVRSEDGITYVVSRVAKKIKKIAIPAGGFDAADLAARWFEPVNVVPAPPARPYIDEEDI